jgi:SAM-dependent methyltransferase
LRRLLSLSLPAGATVLDAPCGAGQLVAALVESGLNAFGADLDTEAQAILGDRFRTADLNGILPWPDASFDAVVSTEGIEHLENRFQFLRELHRVLRKGSRLLLTTPNIVSLRSRVRFFGSGFFHRDSRPLNECAHHPLHHIGLATFSDLRYALHTSGFRLEHASATHSKAVSFLYAVLVPWMWVYTRVAFRKEKDPLQRARNREIRRTLFSRHLLFGENLLLIASKTDPDDQPGLRPSPLS